MSKSGDQLSRDAAQIHREVCPRNPGKTGWFLTDSVNAVKGRQRAFQTYNRITVATAEIQKGENVEYLYAVSRNRALGKPTEKNFLWEGLPKVGERLGYKRAHIGVSDRHAEQIILTYIERYRKDWSLTKIAPSIKFCDQPPIRSQNIQHCMAVCRKRFPSVDLIHPRSSVPGALP